MRQHGTYMKQVKIDSFFTFILSFENGISNEWILLPAPKKSRHLFDKNS